MANKRISDLRVEGARIAFRNFAGKEGTYNAAGKRNFCVMIDPELAEALKADGWNVKVLRPRTEDDDPQPYIQVAVSYENVPPKIWLITGTSKTLLDEDSCSSLDYAEIAKCDLVVSPYCWEMKGRTGVKAYLKTMYVTIVEDEFEKKYRNVPDSAKSNAEEETIPW